MEIPFGWRGVDPVSSFAVGLDHGTIVDSRATEMSLNSLASLKLLEKRDGTFFNTPTSARFFSEGSRDNACPGLLHTAHLWHHWSTLTECVRKGTSVETHNREDNWVTAFIAAMDRNARERAGSVVKAIGTSGIQRMLDLGDGSGRYSIAFANSNPDLKSQIFDLADVVPLAQQYIRKAGLSDRITTQTGDMLRDPPGRKLQRHPGFRHLSYGFLPSRPARYSSGPIAHSPPRGDWRYRILFWNQARQLLVLPPCSP